MIQIKRINLVVQLQLLKIIPITITIIIKIITLIMDKIPVFLILRLNNVKNI